MSERPRSDLRNRAPTSRGPEAGGRRPRSDRNPSVSSSEAGCIVHAGAHRRHGRCCRAANRGLRTWTTARASQIGLLRRLLTSALHGRPGLPQRVQRLVEARRIAESGGQNQSKILSAPSKSGRSFSVPSGWHTTAKDGPSGITIIRIMVPGVRTESCR